jgi:preprotein translocase subunit SecG
MYTFIMTVHVLACFLLILIVLVQPSKGGGFAIYGGGGDTLFSAGSGTSFMKQMTAGCAITFAITSLLLTLLASRSGLRSVVSRLPAEPPSAPASPAPATPPTQAPPGPVAPPNK